MEHLLTSIVANCRKLGLEEQARLIEAQAKLNSKLPHLSPEIQYVEELYDLFRQVANLDPDQVPSNVPSIASLPLDVSNRPQRVIVGQIGFMLHTLYREGFAKHSLHRLRVETRDAHLTFGVKLQDLVHAIGVYWNSVDPEQTKVEFNSEGQLGNNRLVTCSRTIDKLINELEVRIERYAADTSLENFDDQSVEPILNQCASTREALAYIIRTVYKASTLPVDQLDNLANAIKQVLKFVRSFDAVDSQLDVSRELTLPNLAYQAIKHTNKPSKRNTLTSEEYPPALRYHANVARSASETYSDNAKTFRRVLREFKKSRLALAQYNQKTNDFLNKLQKNTILRMNEAAEICAFLRDSVARFLKNKKFNDQQITKEVALALPDDYLEELAEAFYAEYSVDRQTIATVLADIFSPNPLASAKGLFTAPYDDYIKLLDSDQENSVQAILAQMAVKWRNSVSMGTFVADPAYDIDYLSNELIARLESLSKNPTAVIDDEQKIYQLFALGASGELFGTDHAKTKKAINLLLAQLGLDDSAAETVVAYIEDLRTILRQLTQEGDLQETSSADVKKMWADFQTFIQSISKNTRAQQVKEGTQLLLSGEGRSANLTIESIISRILSIEPQDLISGKYGYFVPVSSITAGRLMRTAAGDRPFVWEFEQHITSSIKGAFDSQKIWTFNVIEGGNIELTRAVVRPEDKKVLPVGKPEVFVNKSADPTEILDEINARVEKEAAAGPIKGIQPNVVVRQLGAWYTTHPKYTPGTTQSSDEVQFDTDQQREIIHNKGPNEQLEKVRKQIDTPESKKREPSAPETIRENALQFNPKVPPIVGKNTQKFLATLQGEYAIAVKYKQQLELQVKDSYNLLKETAGLIKASFDSARSPDNIDTSFRILINLYADIQVPKAPWIDWKNKFNYITKMTAQSLVDVEAAADNAAKGVQHTRFHGSTIDRVYDKFEDLVKFVGLYD